MKQEESRENGKLEFYYDKEERLSSLSPDVRDRKKSGWLRGNRGMIILLLDILFLAALFAIVSPFIRKAAIAKTEIFAGNKIHLTAFAEDGIIFTNIMLTGMEAADEKFVSVKFSTNLKNIVIHDQNKMPGNAGEVVTLYGSMVMEPGVSEVIAEVETQGESIILTVSVDE